MMSSRGFTVAQWAAGAILLGLVNALVGIPIGLALLVGAGFFAIGFGSTAIRQRARRNRDSSI